MVSCIDRVRILKTMAIHFNTACARRYLLRRRRERNCVSVENELYEVMKFSDGPRSWFIDNTLQTGVYVLHSAYVHLYIIMCTPLQVH